MQIHANKTTRSCDWLKIENYPVALFIFKGSGNNFHKKVWVLLCVRPDPRLGAGELFFRAKDTKSDLIAEGNTFF